MTRTLGSLTLTSEQQLEHQNAMARPLRIVYPGAWFHAMNRGAGRAATFLCHADYLSFVDVLGDACALYDVEVHAWCLMTNHYHLLLRIREANLSEFMRQVGAVYTQRFNSRHERDGALFRGRFRAQLVQDSEYVLAVNRYIHRNPIDAGLARRPEDYRWSSYREFIGLRHSPTWLHTDRVLGEFSGNDMIPRYRRFVVADEVEHSLPVDFDPQKPIAGSEAFCVSVMRDVAEHVEVPQSRTRESRTRTDDIVAVVAELLNVSPGQCRQRHMRGNLARDFAMFLSRSLDRRMLSEVASEFGLQHYASASRVCRSMQRRVGDDQALAHLFEQAVRRLGRNAEAAKLLSRKT